MCTERYINLFTDFGFKRAFGTAANKEYMISFLNSLIVDDDPIIDITYRNVENYGYVPADRMAIYDLYCTTQSKSHIIVEMQNARQNFFVDRSIYYSTFPIWDEAKKGQWDFKLPKVYTIAFLNFKIPALEGNPDYRHEVKLMDIDTKKVFYDKLTYIYLELPKFKVKASEIEDSNILNTWLFIIKNLHKLDKLPPGIQGEIFKRFFEMAEIAAFTKEERNAYEQSLKNMRDYDNTIVTAKEEGLVKGREEGLVKGREEGKAAALIETARNMLRKDIDIKTVAEVTGLSVDECSDIAKQI